MNNFLSFFRKHRYHSALYLSYLILAFLSLCFIDKLRLLSYGTDQFGYWGIAASFAGFDWSDLLALNDYYSFGYSLLLIPLYLLYYLGLDMTVIHILAIIMNGAFLLASFRMAIFVAGRLFPHLNRYYSMLICLVTTLYVSNIAQIYTAWTELCLYFTFWVVCCCLIKVLEEPRCKYILLLLFSSAYLFTVHMRALGVVIAVGLILILAFFFNKKKFSRKQIFLSLLSGIILLVAVLIIKDWITQNIYSDNINLATNDFAGQSNKLRQTVGSLTGLYNFLLSILGKLYYLGISSWGFAFLALSIILFKLLRIVGAVVKHKQKILSSTEIVFIFVGMSGMAQICISALFKPFQYDGPLLADTICHGRYTDFIIGPLLLIGFAVLPEISKYIREIILSLMVLFICSVIVQSLFDMAASYPQSVLILRPIAVTGMLYLFPDGFNTGAYFPALVSAGMFLIIIFVSLFESLKQKRPLRIPITVVLLLITGGVWGSFGLKAVDALLMQDTLTVNAAELFSDLDEATDIFLVHDPTDYIHDELRNIQWLHPNLKIQVISSETFDAFTTKTSTSDTIANDALVNESEAIFISRADNYPLMAQISDRKKMIYNSGTLCFYAGLDSAVSKLLTSRLETIYRGGRLISRPVDLEKMLTDLSYQKYNGSLYYNFNREGYITWSTGLHLADGIYEFSIDMEIADLVENSEIGYITVTDSDNSYLETYPLIPQDFDRRGQGTIRISVCAEDYAEPIVGIYTYGNCSMKIDAINYRQIQGNIAPGENKSTHLMELGAILAKLSETCAFSISYIDSDSSAINGFPDFTELEEHFPGGIAEIIPAALVPLKTDLSSRYYIVENTDHNEILLRLLEEDNIVIFKNQSFTLVAPNDRLLREVLVDYDLNILATGKQPIDVRFLYDTGQQSGRLNEMNALSLPRGCYEVTVDFTALADDPHVATIIINGQETIVTREMLSANHYKNSFTLELTETSSDVWLGLLSNPLSRITSEAMTIQPLGAGYGYINDIPTYTLEYVNATGYDDCIITDPLSESRVTLSDIFLDYGEYHLTFTALPADTTYNSDAKIRIFRDGELRTEEALHLKALHDYSFVMSEYEPTFWSFEIICPTGSSVQLSDFEIVR
ncbi:MAG: hypothetical protein LBV33_07245 [Lachnospiraceae bacterium]|jgi:hypothetical protein|nr:hypothetical protein [Lachnospiraceae bacterium]